MTGREPAGTWALIDEIRTAVNWMRLQPARGPGGVALQSAVAELLEELANATHERIGAAAQRRSWWVHCSCGGVSLQRDQRPSPCGRLSLAAAVATEYLKERQL